MKLAVVINISPAPGALALALQTQELLLEHMSAQLHSIRLAVPRLLERACLAAIADQPDMLVLAGGPRAARRAGQIAHERRVPIIFLPGIRTPQWTSRLWGALSLKELIERLAREDISPLRFGVGSAAGQIFFDSARCGVLPQFAQLRTRIAQAEDATEWFVAMKRAANCARHALRPKLRIGYDGSQVRDVTTLAVVTQGALPGASGPRSRARLHSFRCETWRYERLTAFGGAVVRALAGADWTRGAQVERFDCRRLRVEGNGATWAVLDEDLICLNGPIAFRFLPGAVETCAFGATRGRTSRDVATGSLGQGTEPARARNRENRKRPSRVALFEDGGERQRKSLGARC